MLTEGDISTEIRDQIEPLVPEWERLAGQTEANPFLWPGWISAWWNAFGVGQLAIFTAYQNGRLVGVLPMHLFRGALHSTTNHDTPLFGFLAANGAAVNQLARALFFQSARRIDLSFLPTTDAGVSLTRAAADATRYKILTQSTPGAPYVSIDRSWDEYVGGLRRKFRSELRRRRRRLEEKGRVTLEVSDGTERLDELLEEGFRIEGSGWKGSFGTSINSSPALRRFYTEVASWAAERGWLRLAFLRLNGQAIAFDYCLEHNKTHYLLKTGYDPAYRELAPGMVLRYLMLARSFSERMATYDFLGVGYDYAWKREWTNTQQELLFMHMFAPTVPGFIDQAAFVTRRAAVGYAKNLAGSSVVGERGYRLLKRGYAGTLGRLSR
jgi:CelD/BcsL family acetyltransferase involved in cellulose biosynthesis